MSIVACKYFEDIGWVIAKNRDRSYKPLIRVRKSFRNNVERLLLWDQKTKYTEGVNEYGVAIVSASISTTTDEIEGAIATKYNSRLTKTPRVYYSPDGLRIRKALFEKTAFEAIRKVIEFQIPGNTIVADKDRCFLIEAGFLNTNEYVYEVVEVPTTHIAVRTNHGIFLPWTGYSADVPQEVSKRKSSDVRYEKVNEGLKRASTFEQFIDVLSTSTDINPQMNPLRVDPRKGAMRTSGQIFIIPKEKTLHYRPIWCDTVFNLDKLNTVNEKTFFEVVSTRKLMSFTNQTM